MTADQLLAQRIRALLEDRDLKVVLDSPDGDYRFEYYTGPPKVGKIGESRYVRTYRLLDLVRGAISMEPWDTYDLDKQTRLVTGLIEFSRYKLARIVSGWTIKCPSCGYIMQGKHWEPIPKICTTSSSAKCRQRLDDAALVQEILVDG